MLRKNPLFNGACNLSQMNEYTIKTFLIFHRYSLKRLPYLKSFTSEFCSINKQPLLDWTSERTSSGQLKEFL